MEKRNDYDGLLLLSLNGDFMDDNAMYIVMRASCHVAVANDGIHTMVDLC